MRQFYNEDGSIAYREYIDEDEHVFVFDDARLYSKQALVAYFIRQLRLDSDDIIIIDRATDVRMSFQNFKVRLYFYGENGIH